MIGLVRVSRTRGALIALSVAALACTAAWLAARHWLSRETGLRLEVTASCEAGASPPQARVVGRLRSDDVLPGGPCTRARWTAFWLATTSEPIRLRVVGDGAVVVRADGRDVCAGPCRSRDVIQLEGSPREIEIEWAPPDDAQGRLRVQWAPPRGEFRSLDDAWLFPARPSTTGRTLVRSAPWLAPATAGAWVLLLALVSWRAFACNRAALLRLWAQARACVATLATPSASRRVALVLATLVVLYGAALRLEALRGGYWGEAAPHWVSRVADLARHLHPETFHWPLVDRPYEGGDPGAYLRYGREMHSLYEPRVREPIFVLATKVGLLLADGRDVGVSVASTFFSVLALILTYALGAYAFSRWVGLGAALALAIERQAIAQGVSGWRDEAFACFVLLVAWTALRLYDRGLFRDAVWLGLSSGLAWLTRITSPTLILPVVVALAVFPRSRPRRLRLERAALAALLALAVAAPFLVNCAIAFGDPFYSINEHVVFYRTRSHLEYTQGMTVADYLTKSFRPWQMADTVFIGFSEYPFAQKWSYADWAPWLGPGLAGAALVGLFLWLGSPRGRLLLLTHLAALAPFVFTYEAREGGPWRLTFHAYPFYLLAAFSALAFLARLLVSASARRALRDWLTPRGAVWLAAGLTFITGSAWVLWNGLYYMRFAEAVRAGERASAVPLFFAGTRDSFFFGEGWRPPRQASVSGRYVRVSGGGSAVIRLPLAGGRPVKLVLALDPYFVDARSMPSIGVALNGRELTTLTPGWDPEKLGRYVVDVPAEAARDGTNRLTLTASHATLARDVVDRPAGVPDDALIAFGLQHVAVRPPGAGARVTRPRSRPASSEPGSARRAPGNERPGE